MKILKQPILVFWCLIFWSITDIHAQEVKRLKGHLVETRTGKSIPYVTVRIKGVPLGTITDLNGQFAIRLPAKYFTSKLIFSSVGYVAKEISVTDLKENYDNRIELIEDVRELASVTVSTDKRVGALEILKRAIKKIPDNYQNQQNTFNAYYRERITENGAVIKYADAAVTFDQSGYDGKKFDLEAMGSFGGWKSARRAGPWLGGYVGIGSVGERLHDHFRHRTYDADRVKIIESRVSLNHTRENFMANIEGGPLATLSKDLVKYVTHFMDKRNFGKYEYELLEVPDEFGEWFYIIKFKPKRAPKEVVESYQIGGLGNRTQILTGEVHIEPDSYVIKKMNYHVSNEYRGHICSLGLMEIVHYGYQVNVDYAEQGGKWQMNSIKRQDEFLFQDTVTQKTTPYMAISEILVTDQPSSIEVVSEVENFANKGFNSLQDYTADYNQKFWNDYEKQVSLARLNDSLIQDMEAKIPLNQQFLMRRARNKNRKLPEASSRPTKIDEWGISVVDNYHWLKKEALADPDARDYFTEESDYAHHYFLPLKVHYDDLFRQLEVVKNGYDRAEATTQDQYKNWSQFKKSKKGQFYQTRIIRTDGGNGPTTPVSLLFMGKDKDRFLDARPIFITVLGKDKLGARLEFDPLLIPLLRMGVIFAYVHVEGASALGPEGYLKGDSKKALNSSHALVNAIKFLKENEIGHKDKFFASSQGVGAAVLARAITLDSSLVQGAFFDLAETDPVNSLMDPSINSKLNQWSKSRNRKLFEAMKEFSPYENITSQHYPNMTFFSSMDSNTHWQSAKTVAKLRANNSDKNVLLFITATEEERQARLPLLAYKYTLMFQWLDDLN